MPVHVTLGRVLHAPMNLEPNPKRCGVTHIPSFPSPFAEDSNGEGERVLRGYAFVMRSAPPRYGRSAVGISTLPSSC